MVSVVLALYNGEKFIKEQIESILNQTKSVDEIIICDDCSIDKSHQIISEILKSEHKVQIRYIQNGKNLGYIKNFYKGISESNGDIIFLSDQDDKWKPNKVEIMLSIMEETNAELLCSNFELIDENGDTCYGNYRVPKFISNAPKGVSKVGLNTLIYGNIAQGCTYCFTRKIKELYVKMNNSNIIHDYQLMMIAAALNKAYFVNRKLIEYRLHGSNSVGFKSKKDLSHIKFRFPTARPKVVEIIEFIKPYISHKDYLKYKFILYFRIPVIKAIINRYFGK